MKKQTRTYTPTDSMYPAMGINTIVPGTQLDSRFSPDLLNVDIVKGLITKRRGYRAIGDGFPDPLMLVVEFEDLSGVRSLLAFTTKKQYILDVGTLTWLDITYQVAAADVDWTGDEKNIFDYAIVTGLDGGGNLAKWIIVTNGVNKPRYWDGTARFKLYTPTGISGFVTCKAISQFYNHVLLGNVTTIVEGRQVIYWSNAQTLIDFTNGDTGAAVITDVESQILKFVPLGDRMTIYGENSISSMTYLAGAIVFTFDHVSKQTRLVSSRAIVNLGPFHLFLSQENVMIFDGSRLTQTIGDRIYRTYIDELSHPDAFKAIAFHDIAKQHVLFVVPKDDDEAVVYKLEYDLSNIRDGSKWTKSTFALVPTTFGYYSQEEHLRWNSPSVTNIPWNQINMTWRNATIRSGFPVRIFATTEGIFLTDDSMGTDAGVAIESWWTSSDFVVPEAFRSQLGRWIELEMDLMGFGVTVQYSTDEGLSYVDVETLVLTQEFTRYRLPIDVMSRSFRVRLYNNQLDSPFSMRWVRVWVKPGGAD